MSARAATARKAPPADQAQGLRRMFGAEHLRFVPLVHNPFVPGAGVVMERLCAAAATLGRRTLVVDAADSATTPHELATVDLAACVERLSPSVSYLAARGLPVRYLDNRATMARFREALRGAAAGCGADLVLLHAGASDLRRIFAGRAPRPILLAGSRPTSLTDAYASMKLLAQRLGALTYDLVIASDVGSRRARRMAERLGECADHFLGSALRHCAVVDAAEPVRQPPGVALRRLVAAQLDSDDELPAPPVVFSSAYAARPGAAASTDKFADPMALLAAAVGRVN